MIVIECSHVMNYREVFSWTVMLPSLKSFILPLVLIIRRNDWQQNADFDRSVLADTVTVIHIAKFSVHHIVISTEVKSNDVMWQNSLVFSCLLYTSDAADE